MFQKTPCPRRGWDIHSEFWKGERGFTLLVLPMHSHKIKRSSLKEKYNGFDLTKLGVRIFKVEQLGVLFSTFYFRTCIFSDILNTRVSPPVSAYDEYKYCCQHTIVINYARDKQIYIPLYIPTEWSTFAYLLNQLTSLPYLKAVCLSLWDTRVQVNKKHLVVLKQIQQEAIVKPLLLTSQGSHGDPMGRGGGLSLGALRSGSNDKARREPPPPVPKMIQQSSQLGEWVKWSSRLVSNKQVFGQGPNTWGVHNTRSLTVMEHQFAATVHKTMNLYLAQQNTGIWQ